jgi:2,3-bisphosphoglycerate-dependent phosphoglycerate mutase
MQFYFIRHGQSVNNLLWDQTGSNTGRSIDAELSPIGQRQAQVLAEFLSRTDPIVRLNNSDSHNLAGFGLTHLYTSLMVRAVATATVIADKLGLPLVTWADLHETGGIYVEDEQTGECIGQPGKNRAYFEAHYPRLVLADTLDEAGWWNRPFEEHEQRSIRAQRFLSDLMKRHGHTDDRVAVVSHGAFYNYLLAALLKMPQKDGYWFHMNNVAITRIDFRDGEVGLVYMNRVDFLPKELVT